MNKFRNFPQINTLINDKNLKDYPLYLRNYFSKHIIYDLKQKAKNDEIEINKEKILKLIKNEIENFLQKDLKSLINATGVVIHTNLGRSVINEEIFDNTKDLICSYTNLEFDLNNGKRGSRYNLLLDKLKILFDCEDCLVVNNNASAVFLILNTFAKNKEVISSRGELVEIGGKFRIPEVINGAGALLCEVGTTNKTHLKDYEKAINENSVMILKTHRSNFAIEGFNSEVNIEQLHELCNKNDLISYYDLGSGWCENLNEKLTKNEPSIKQLQKNTHLISFSGDKLFGSVQAGIILGEKKYIDKLKENQLLRMLRVDKLTLAFLNETLKCYLEKKYNKITTLKLLNDNIDEIYKKALKVKENIKISCKIKDSKSLVGGGSMPNKYLDTKILAFEENALKMQEKFRKNGIIGRIEKDEFVLDFRSIEEKYLDILIQKINNLV